MNDQREILQSILASDVPFKAKVTVDFDISREMVDVPLKLSPGEQKQLFDSVVDNLALEDFAERGYVPAHEIEIRDDEITRLTKKVKTLAKLTQADMVGELRNEIAELNKKLVKAAKKPPVADSPQPKARGKRGPYNPALSKEQVWDIRDYIKLGKKDSEIPGLMGDKFKTSTVWRIRSGLSYKTVGDRPHSSTQARSTVHVGHNVEKGEGATS